MSGMLFSWWGLATAALGLGGVGLLWFAPGVVVALRASGLLRPALAVLGVFVVGWGLVQWGENRATRRCEAAAAERRNEIQTKDREINRLAEMLAKKDTEKLNELAAADAEFNKKLEEERSKLPSAPKGTRCGLSQSDIDRVHNRRN